MTVVFNDTLGVYGGSQTLMVRMCKWLNENHHKIVIFCDDASNIEIVSEMKTLNVIIECSSPYDYRFISNKLKKYLLDDGYLLVINLAFSRYLNIECIKRKYKLSFNNIIYDIIPTNFLKGASFKSKFIINHCKKIYSDIILRMIDNNAIKTLEYTYIDVVRDYFGFTKEQYNPQILPLPMICKHLNNKDEIISRGYDSRIIMSAARADFPFKGYLVGLIDEFAYLKAEFPDLKLEIYAAGADINILQEKISGVSTELKKDIFLSGWISYDELYEKLKTIKVFIGMGTSVMDAGLNYKPAVVVSYDTMRCLSNGLFAENPFCTATHGDGYPDARVVLEKVMSSSFEEYKTMSIQSYDEVYKNYDIKNIMNSIINVKNKNKECILTRYECFENNLNNLKNRIKEFHKIDKNRYKEN